MQDADLTHREPAAAVGSRPGKGRRIAFRVVATLVALWFLALNIFGLLELVVMWFPAETLAEMFEEETAYIDAHRAHFMAIGIVSWAVVLSTVVQLRKPERRVAPMLFLLTAASGGMVLFGLSGSLGEWLVEEIAMVVAPVVALAVLHPGRDRFFDRPRFDRPLLGLSALAALPWLVFTGDNAWAQFTNATGDPHAEAEHWALAALLGVVILAASVLGSSDHTGWRLPAWIAAGASVVFGAHSLVYPGAASALSAFWAVAAVIWGVVFAARLIQRSRRGLEPVTDVETVPTR